MVLGFFYSKGKEKAQGWHFSLYLMLKLNVLNLYLELPLMSVP